MKNIDFTNLIKKYPLLTIEDVSFLNDFFNRDEIIKVLNQAEQFWKSLLKITYKIFILFILIALFFILVSSWVNTLFSIMLWSIIILVVWFFISFFISYLINNNWKKPVSIKDSIIPNFVSKINSDLKYSSNWGLFNENLDILASKSIIENYSRIDWVQDSIEYKIKSQDKDLIEIYWVEAQTSKKVKTKNWHRYDKNNHFYILKVIFNNPRFKINTPIKLIEDLTDNHIKKILKVIVIQFSIIFAFLVSISWDEDTDWFLPEFFDLVSNNLEISTVFLFGMFFVIYFIYDYFKWDGRVKVENIEFEKEFDVYSDDQIEARKLLTPSFMYRLVDFVNKISRKRVYELYFHENYFYLKYNIMSTNSLVNLNLFWSNNFLEFSSIKSIDKNLEKFVEFYLEMKNITNLSKDLKLFYYDKWTMSTEIVK